MRKKSTLVLALTCLLSTAAVAGCSAASEETQGNLDRDPTEPAPIDFTTLKPGTVDAVADTLDIERGSLAVQFKSVAVKRSLKSRIALLVLEREMSVEVPREVLVSAVRADLDIDTIMTKLEIPEATFERLAVRLSTTPSALRSSYATSTDEKKMSTLGKLFKLQYPPALPIATIEELTNGNASLEKVLRILHISQETLATIAKLEGHPVARGTMTAEEDWTSLPAAKRVDLQAKLFKHENMIPAYDDAAADAKRTARLEALLEADANRPGFWSNVGDFALASIVNIVSDYAFFNAFRWNPAEHNGQHVSMAYRVYQVALQAYSSLWLMANHGTGSGGAFWWNQWNATNDFGYYAVGSIVDKLGIKPEGWDGAGWTRALFDDRNPPTWFSWTLWALTHPGEPTTGTNIMNASLDSFQVTTALLLPSLNVPWRTSTCTSFWCKVSRFLSKLVPKAVF
ncbi:MAG: hypothetical protein U0174_08660 [Polyangiaceae bacterium]